MKKHEMPITPLWIKDGRVLLEVQNYKISTPNGVTLAEPTDVLVKTGLILSASDNLVELGIKPGTYVLFNNYVGAAIKLNFLKNDTHVLIHGMDLMAKWDINPQEFFEKAGAKPEPVVIAIPMPTDDTIN